MRLIIGILVMLLMSGLLSAINLVSLYHTHTTLMHWLMRIESILIGATSMSSVFYWFEIFDK